VKGVEEAEEVLVDVEGAGGFGSEGRGVVAAAELEQGLGLDGAFEVKVELYLGEAAKPLGWVGVGVLLGLLAGHGLSLCLESMVDGP